MGGGDITFGSTLNGNHDLTLTAGTGDVTFTGAVATFASPLGALTINSAADVTASAAITATAVVITADAFTLENRVVARNVSLTASSGRLRITGGGRINARGAVILTASNGIRTAGDINTRGGDISFNSATTLTSDVTLSTRAGGGDITFGSTLNGNHDLTLTAGTGDVTFTGAVGTFASPLGALTINSAADVRASAAIAATAEAITANAFTLENRVVARNVSLTASSGRLRITGGGRINAGGAVTLTGQHRWHSDRRRHHHQRRRHQLQLRHHPHR